MKFTKDLSVTCTVPAWKANRLLAERVIENPGVAPDVLRAELEEDLAKGIVIPRKRKARAAGEKIADAEAPEAARSAA